MNKIFKIAKQELKMTAANKAFVIITLLGPFIILALAVVPSLLIDKTGIAEGTKIGVIGVPEDLEEAMTVAFQENNLELVSGISIEQMKTLLFEDALQGILVLPSDFLQAENYLYYSKTGTDMMISETLSGILNHLAVTTRLEKAGFNPQEVTKLSFKAGMVVRKLGKTGEEEAGQGFSDIFFTSFSFVMLIYMTVLLYGQMIGRSVVKEKTSKTVEIMLSSVTPKQMMFGKILGLGSAGLLQYASWILLALVLVKIVGPVLNLPLPKALNPGNLLYLVLFFICAYFLYSSAYAALGAASEDEQHLGQLAMPLIIFLIIPLMTLTSVIMNPKTPFAQVLSYFPLTSPIIMLARVLVEEPPLWQILLSFFILILSILLMVYLAAKIFRVGILLSGKRFKLQEIIKWIRY